MARVVVSTVAQTDTATILRDLAMKAARGGAADYTASLKALGRPSRWRAPRPGMSALDSSGRMSWAYRHVPDSDLVGVIRVLHGSRHITRKLLRGAS